MVILVQICANWYINGSLFLEKMMYGSSSKTQQHIPTETKHIDLIPPPKSGNFDQNLVQGKVEQIGL